jgi:hypothetical protein
VKQLASLKHQGRQAVSLNFCKNTGNLTRKQKNQAKLCYKTAKKQLTRE